LLHGYIAPQTSGTSMPTWRANGEESRLDNVSGVKGADEDSAKAERWRVPATLRAFRCTHVPTN
jgi:hypothetical protein